MGTYAVKSTPLDDQKAMRREIKKIAAQYCPRLFLGLIRMATDENNPVSVRLAATKEVLDRGLGKPVQLVGEDEDHRFATAADEAREFLARQLGRIQAVISGAPIAAISVQSEEVESVLELEERRDEEGKPHLVSVEPRSEAAAAPIDLAKSGVKVKL